jgi:DNA-binding CsgD family transcriptional regulator
VAGTSPELTETFAGLGGDVDSALEDLRLPAFVIGLEGRLRWQNAESREWFGDVTGRHYTEVLAPESRPGARVTFTRKVLGTEHSSRHERWLQTPGGDRVLAEVHAVAIEGGERVVGVFGIISPPRKPKTRPASLPHRGLTPRQLEVLDHLSNGMSTDQIAAALGIQRETVRNHVRGILRTLGVHSRLEAVVQARRRGLLPD